MGQEDNERATEVLRDVLDDRQSKLAALDETNYRHQQRYLQQVGVYDTGTLAIEVYETGREIVNASGVALRDDIVFGMIFFMRSQYALEKGITEILRLHFTDALAITRQVVEGAGFADRVRRHPHLAMTWLEAVKDETRYDVYREKFAPGKLFPEDDDLLKTLGTWFGWASRHFHVSPFAFGTSLSMDGATGGDRQLLFSYTDVRNSQTGPAQLVTMYLAYLNVHLAAFDVFARVFTDGLRHVRVRWDEAFHRFEASLLEQKRRLAPALAGRAAPSVE